jgi:hypothetical protein
MATLPSSEVVGTSFKTIRNLALGSYYHMACPLSKRNGNEQSKSEQNSNDITIIKPHERINIYPNPVNDMLYIDIPSTIASIEIVDVVGKSVYKGKAINHLPISFIPNGVYLIKLYKEEGLYFSQKLLINHD